MSMKSNPNSPVSPGMSPCNELQSYWADKTSRNNQRPVTGRYSQLFQPHTFPKEHSNFVFDPTAKISGWNATVTPPQKEEKRSPSPVLPSLTLPIRRNRRRKSELSDLEAMLRSVIKSDTRYLHKPKVNHQMHSEVTDASLAYVKTVRPVLELTRPVGEDSPFTAMVQGENPKTDSSENIVRPADAQSLLNKSATIAESMAIYNIISHDPLPTMQDPHMREQTFRRSSTTIPNVTVIEESARNVSVGDVDTSQVPVAAIGGNKVEARDVTINDYAPPECKTPETYIVSREGSFLTPSNSLDVKGSQIFDCIEVRSDFENAPKDAREYCKP